MAAAMESHIRLAQQLPPRLLNFFKRFPPPQLRTGTAVAPIQAASQKPVETIQIAETTSSSDPNVGSSTTTVSTEPDLAAAPTTAPLDDRSKRYHNPFLPFKNPRTGNWHGPQYSLRRQADLFKLAKQHNVLPLMPISPKHPEVKEQKRIENGLRVQGTGIGKKVKGKAWERQLSGKLEARRKAMEGMPEMIKQWKLRGHGRGWKKWPK